MDVQKTNNEVAPEGVKRVIKPDADSDKRAESGPYARELEDYTDETLVTPPEGGDRAPRRNPTPR